MSLSRPLFGDARCALKKNGGEHDARRRCRQSDAKPRA
jgi:hypothetical protein